MLTGLLTIRTDLGWLGIQTVDGQITRSAIGNSSRKDLLTRFDSGLPMLRKGDCESMVQKLIAFCNGNETSLRSLKIDESWMTPFQSSVVNVCRGIHWGETLTYGQVAQLAGYPGASRAVGTVMSRNRFPVIVPCHRVCSSNGLGGFSAPRGVSLKRQMLENEGALTPINDAPLFANQAV